MITVNGKNHKTVKDAAKELGDVTSKTVLAWIERGIIDEPPRIDYGLRKVRVFSDSFIKKAEKDLDDYRKSQEQEPQQEEKIKKQRV